MTTVAGAQAPGVPTRGSRILLGLAAVAVAFAAADTYVVVLALPDMMSSVGLGVDELQRAAPIVSGFLLGYVAVLPLIGRIADLRGRVPVLVGSLLVFALGSLVTAAAYDLPSMVTGRFLQGVGGGGLVPGDAGAGRRPLPAGRGAGSRSASSARCRSWAACSARCTARWSSPSPTGRTSSGSTSPPASCSPPPSPAPTRHFPPGIRGVSVGTVTRSTGPTCSVSAWPCAAWAA